VEARDAASLLNGDRLPAGVVKASAQVDRRRRARLNAPPAAEVLAEAEVRGETPAEDRLPRKVRSQRSLSLGGGAAAS